MCQIGERMLWIGNAGDLQDVQALLTVGVQAVVELADSEQFAGLPRELVRCRFPLSDGGENPTWLLRLAAESVASLLRANVPVLICCSAGLSRSVCVTAAGVSLADECPLAEALSMVAGSGPSDVSPGLWIQFQKALGDQVKPTTPRSPSHLPRRSSANRGPDT